jgi:hypothetical protein
MTGNFPQAFSHIALVNTAHNIALANMPRHKRPRHTPGMRMCASRREQGHP